MGPTSAVVEGCPLPRGATLGDTADARAWHFPLTIVVKDYLDQEAGGITWRKKMDREAFPLDNIARKEGMSYAPSLQQELEARCTQGMQ